MTVEGSSGSAPSGDVAGPGGPDLRSLARGGTLNLLGHAAGAILGFLLVLIVARGLGPAGAGEFFASIALFMILANATELGADTGLVRFVARYRALGRVGDVRPTVRAALVPVLVAGACAMVLVFVFAPDLAELIKVPGGEGFLRVFSPFLLVGGASTVLLSGARGFGTMRPYVVVENVGKPALRAALALALVWAGFGAAALALGWAVPVALGFAAGAIWMRALVRRTEGEAAPSPPAAPASRLSAEFWRFSAPRALAGIFQISITWLDVLIVSALVPAGQVGVYATTGRLVMVGTFVLQAIRLAIAPQISGLLARERREDAEHLYQVATWWLIAVSWPLYLSLAVFAPFVLGVFGDGFRRGEDVLVILCCAMLLNLGTGTITAVLLMGGKSSWNLANAAGAVTINVVLNLVLVPRLGIRGAAIAWAASIAFDNLAALIEVWLLLRIRPFGRGYAPAVLGAVVCFGAVGLVVRAWLGEGWLAAVCFALASVALYLPLLWRLRGVLRLGELIAAFRSGRGDGGDATGVRGAGGAEVPTA